MSRIITTVLAIGALLCSMLLSYTASISINPIQNITTEAKNKPNTLTEKISQLDKSPKIIEYQLVSSSVF